MSSAVLGGSSQLEGMKQNHLWSCETYRCFSPNLSLLIQLLRGEGQACVSFEGAALTTHPVLKVGSY